MADWREAILSEFTPEVARLTIAFDPDGLLLEQNLLDRVLQRGFEVVQLEDEVQFRFVYESRFRARWDRGEGTEMIVDVRGSGQASTALPHDILSKGRTVEFSLAGLFPQLSYPVVASLDRADFDALYQAVVQFRPDPLGENATKDFVLRHVFEIAPELIKTPVELLRVLLRRHYRAQRIPELVERRLIEVLRTRPAFKDWPLERIVPDRNEFLRFLQERWPHYLSSFTSGVAEQPLMEIPGPVALPFDHEDIRVYVDNYFVEGLLQPVEHEAGDRLLDRWVAVGLRAHRGREDPRRVQRLIELTSGSVPPEGCPFQDWCHFASRWAELQMGLYRLPDRLHGTANVSDTVSQLQAAVDGALFVLAGPALRGFGQPAAGPAGDGPSRAASSCPGTGVVTESQSGPGSRERHVVDTVAGDPRLVERVARPIRLPRGRHLCLAADTDLRIAAGSVRWLAAIVFPGQH